MTMSETNAASFYSADTKQVHLDVEIRGDAPLFCLSPSNSAHSPDTFFVYVAKTNREVHSSCISIIILQPSFICIGQSNVI